MMRRFGIGVGHRKVLPSSETYGITGPEVAVALLTEREADRIIEAHFEITGMPSSLALVNAWQSMVFQMLERLELDEWRREVVRLARQVVALWRAVHPASTWPAEHQFLFTEQEVPQLQEVFTELNRLALLVLLATPDLPPRSMEERERDVEAIKQIAHYCRAQMERITAAQQENDGSAMLYCTAATFGTVADRCMTLMAVTLGSGYTSLFKEQYDRCIGSWYHAAKLLQTAVSPTLH
jgi:hypothetical protein